MQKLQLYAIIALLVTSVGSGVAIRHLWAKNKDLKAEVSQLKASRAKAQENLVLVSEQLAREQLTRKAAQDALSSLQHVPSAEYNDPLPDSISAVLDAFHGSLQ